MTRRLPVAIALFIAAFNVSFALAATPPAPLTRPDVEAIIKDYLMEHPEVIIDAVNNYQKKQEGEAFKKAQATIASRGKDIFENPATPAVGDAKKTDVRMAMFFDYHCGYCKRMLPVLTQLINEDPKVRVVFHEFPILSEDSALAAKAALAVYALKPDAYFSYHTALMKMSGTYTEDTLAAEAKKLGVNEAKFREKIKDPALAKEIDTNRSLGKDIGIRGTPALIINNELIPGAIDIEDVKKLLAKARESGKAASGANPSN